MTRFPGLIAFPPPAPQYFVDGSVATADVFIDTGNGDLKTWKSVLVGGLRQGGKHYYALDVTQPDVVPDLTTGIVGTDALSRDRSPACLDGGRPSCPSNYPTVLWELTDTITPTMGETWSRPVVGRIKVGDGTSFVDAHVAIFGGGFDPGFTPGTEVLAGDTTTSGRAIYIVNVETGVVVSKFTQGVDDASISRFFAPMPAPPAAADVDDDGYLDVAYIGDLNGRMWRLDLSHGVCPTCGTPVPFLLYDAQPQDISSPRVVRPIFYDPGIIFISGGIPPTLGVAFGSGNRADLQGSAPVVNRFVLVKDAGDVTTFRETDLVNLTPPCTTPPCGPGTPTSAGYFLDFQNPNEKTVSTVFSTFGNLSVTTFNPDATNPCDPKGQSFRYSFSFATGKGAYTTTPANSYADYQISLGAGLANAAQGQAADGSIIDTALMQGGQLNQQPNPGGLKTISQSWKEQ
jgi:Tfp pilus tip-associated adhesin PilY1